MIVTRFAPSPTGYLHTGHAYSALVAAEAARAAGGRFLLRIEDIDATRCRPAFEAAIYEDLAWLGLAWESPVRRQSEHFGDYRAALARLDAMGLTYPCFCTRKEIAAEVAASAGAPHGPDGPLYPGTCRRLDAAERASRIAAGEPYALRLDMARAIARTGPLTMAESGLRMPAAPAVFGDVVLARKDVPASYHLAVTVDDALQGVTLVTRGEDLLPASFIHRLLQDLLGLPEPAYRHHPLLTGPDGRRLAKRDGAEALRDVKARGVSAADLRARLGFAASP
ncbi:MAG: tRNA glutamyl-Q(34) synthetase GluQRS [Alphaproteobacteria bacterium]|nr:tRNA glutamyl-Q(34) synthetase GluQRS [Alphaproteobacteria bacterium]